MSRNFVIIISESWFRVWSSSYQSWWPEI